MEHKYLGWIIIACLLTACQSSNTSPDPENARVEIIEKGNGLLPPFVRFSWQAGDQPAAQESFQILVASNQEILKQDIGDLWDSHRRFGANSEVEYPCSSLPAGKKIWWKLRIWNHDGQVGQFSKPQSIRLPESPSGHRIALVGGTLISGMENHGYFESAISRIYPGEEITFRNLGWPADDVFGLARSQFGSAQNTRSWQPPTAQEGFGSKVLSKHITEARPDILIVGYGSETAYGDDEEAFDLFISGYHRLLTLADSLQLKVILLSPPRQEQVLIDQETLMLRNQKLEKTRDFIREEASQRHLLFIDLYDQLITDPLSPMYTNDGVQLNDAGYRRMTDVLLNALHLQLNDDFTVTLDSTGMIQKARQAEITQWKKTVRGVQFNLAAPALAYQGQFDLTVPAAIYLDGELIMKGNGPFSLSLSQDSLRQEQLREEVALKNRLHRYRLRPLNEAYIYLFRRHEMGHLAYEMDDFTRLVEESESNISTLRTPVSHRIDIELIKPWQPPKNYPEDEVPAHIPEPDIAEELSAFTVPDGFEINLFAADPMIANPINLNWDTRGRAWVATSSTYPHIVPGREPNDRIVILEDTDKDGQADLSTVFAEGLLVPHSVMPVPGGAYVTSTTEFLFLADTNGDDIADKREVIFDGFGNADIHHTIHGLRWAPWGDLFFTQSIYINTFVETPYGPRRLNGSGTWIFRPETGRLEIFSRGLINPWGQAFDEWGQSFATDGAGSSGINYIFPESAHATAVGADRVVDGLNSGTPKNTGAEVIYSRHLPASWQGSILASDFRANRTVRYAVQPNGSGYHSQEVQTILHSTHRSYRPVDMKVGPDGAIYIVDWYNPIIDHGEVDFHHPVRDKTHGRVWRLTNKQKPVLTYPRIQENAIPELLDLLKSPEQNTRLQANRELVARKCDPQQLSRWVSNLRQSDPDYERHRVEALWLGAALNYYDDQLLTAVLQSGKPQARAAAVRMIMHWNRQSEKLETLAGLIRDPHPQVRLETIHALRTLGNLRAVELALEALDQPLDANLNFAVWLAAKNLKKVWLPSFKAGQTDFGGDIDKQVFALLACNDAEVVPLMSNLIDDPNLTDTLAQQAWRSFARLGDEKTLTMVLKKATNESDLILLRTMVNAPAANQSVPEDLTPLDALMQHDSLQIRIAATQLVGRWKHLPAAATLESMASNPGLENNERLAAARALIKLDRLTHVKSLTRKTQPPAVRSTASAAWAESEPAEALGTVVDLLQELDSPDDAELLFMTYRRMEEGPALLAKALTGKKLTEPVASAGLRVTQTSGLDLSSLEQVIREAGSLQAVGITLTEEAKSQLLAEVADEGSISRGRAIYRRPQLLCASCHRIDGIGGLIGPDLSSVGAYMTPNSILESILNPSTDIKQGYETVIITKTDGEVLSGTLYRKTETSTLLRQANGDILSIPAAEIAKVDASPVSLMPAGLTASLHRDELRDLVHYLINLGVEKSPN